MACTGESLAHFNEELRQALDGSVGTVKFESTQFAISIVALGNPAKHFAVVCRIGDETFHDDCRCRGFRCDRPAIAKYIRQITLFLKACDVGHDSDG